MAPEMAHALVDIGLLASALLAGLTAVVALLTLLAARFRLPEGFALVFSGMLVCAGIAGWGIAAIAEPNGGWVLVSIAILLSGLMGLWYPALRAPMGRCWWVAPTLTMVVAVTASAWWLGWFERVV